MKGVRDRGKEKVGVHVGGGGGGGGRKDRGGRYHQTH